MTGGAKSRLVDRRFENIGVAVVDAETAMAVGEERVSRRHGGTADL